MKRLYGETPLVIGHENKRLHLNPQGRVVLSQEGGGMGIRLEGIWPSEIRDRVESPVPCWHPPQRCSERAPVLWAGVRLHMVTRSAPDANGLISDELIYIGADGLKCGSPSNMDSVLGGQLSGTQVVRHNHLVLCHSTGEGSDRDRTFWYLV